MLKVELTKNYAGVTIYGDYNDLNFLYDAINYLIHKDPSSDGEYTMQNHLYGFLYDVRQTTSFHLPYIYIIQYIIPNVNTFI